MVERRRTFPDRILMADGAVVDADPMLPTAAAFLDARPADSHTDPAELADGLGIAPSRASVILGQLEALGHVGTEGGDAQRMVFDPDGATDPTPLSSDE